MKNVETADYPKISIITCVYNGEKYISRLLDSVLNMGYPNIEHIIVNDGSTDSTEKIIMRYIHLYEKKEKANLYIKYIKQENMGLGGATNTGLQNISGEYWTWINCDDWYEPNAFCEAMKCFNNSSKLDYVQLNGYIVYGNSISKKQKMVDRRSKMHFSNKKRLYIDYCYGEHFRYLLYICKTSSYKKICPKMQIEYSRYTQDEQFIAQIFGVLNGTICKYPCWNFYRRSDSYYQEIKTDLYNEHHSIFEKSMRLTTLDCKSIISRMYVLEEEMLLMKYKHSCLIHDKETSKIMLKSIKSIRKKIGLCYRFYLDKKLYLYYIHCLL